MNTKRSGEERWERAGRELRFCDPARYVAVLKAAEQIVKIYRGTTYGILPPCVPPRNDNG